MIEFSNKQWNKNRVAELIAENLESESKAIKEYLPLIATLEEGGYKKAVALIREIVSDEKNHLLILQGLMQEFDGGIPVANDDIQEALQKLKNAIKKEED